MRTPHAADNAARRSAPRSDRALTASLVGHGILLLLILVGGFRLPRETPPSQLAIQATVVDRALAPARATPKPELKPEPAPAPDPVEPPAPPKPAPPDPAAVREKAERAKAERAKAEQAKLKEKAAREVAARAQAEKVKAAKEKAAQETAAKEKAAKEKAEREKAAREKAEAERAARDFDRQLAEEERLLAAADSGALADYVASIVQKVSRNWNRPPGTAPGLECELVVSQIPGGTVTDVQVGRCNADDVVRRSIENAVMQASPLPLPKDPALFDRNLRFTFKPQQ